MKKKLHRFLLDLKQNVPDVSFQIDLWNGDRVKFGSGKPEFKLIVKTEKCAENILMNGEFGFCQAYMAGNIVVEGDFRQLMRVGILTLPQKLQLSLRFKIDFLFRYMTYLNFPRRAQKNISHHYNLGNNFYRLWLDKSMAYSCAYFHHVDDSLEQAQQQKYDYICRKLRLAEGETLLDVGCGWGGMLIYAAKHYGIKGVGCTLSKQQVKFSQQKIRDAGLEAQISIQYMDYRDLTGQFDKFVSIGMFEHVGREFIPLFMKKIKTLLKPGGLGLLHTIGKEKKSSVNLWTMKYIFPGGYLPSLDEIVRAMGKIGLVPVDIENLRLHYAMTLDKWSERFEAHTDEIKQMFDETFVRMWRLFLNGSAASFRYGTIRLYHVAFTNGLNNALPLTRSELYGEFHEGSKYPNSK